MITVSLLTRALEQKQSLVEQSLHLAAKSQHNIMIFRYLINVTELFILLRAAFCYYFRCTVSFRCICIFKRVPCNLALKITPMQWRTRRQINSDKKRRGNRKRLKILSIPFVAALVIVTDYVPKCSKTLRLYQYDMTLFFKTQRERLKRSFFRVKNFQ